MNNESLRVKTIENLRIEMANIFNEFDQPEQGRKMLETLKPYVIDFRNAVIEFEVASCVFSPVDFGSCSYSTNPEKLEQFLKLISFNPFVMWLNEQPDFINAKNYLSNQQLLPIDKKIKSKDDYDCFYMLETILATLIQFSSINEDSLNKSIKNINNKRVLRAAMQNLKEHLDKKMKEDVLRAVLDGRLEVDEAEKVLALFKSQSCVVSDYKINTTDPIEASKIYQKIMTGTYKK